MINIIGSNQPKWWTKNRHGCCCVCVRADHAPGVRLPGDPAADLGTLQRAAPLVEAREPGEGRGGHNPLLVSLEPAPATKPRDQTAREQKLSLNDKLRRTVAGYFWPPFFRDFLLVESQIHPVNG